MKLYAVVFDYSSVKKQIFLVHIVFEWIIELQNNGDKKLQKANKTSRNYNARYIISQMKRNSERSLVKYTALLNVMRLTKTKTNFRHF